MDTKQRNLLQTKILKRYELYKLQHSRLKRLIKDPFRTIPYFLMLALAYRHPFKVKYKTLWGDKISFYLPEGNAIYYYGFFEANLTNFFINLLKEGDIFFDIGAHVGFYSVLASRLVEQTGQVHSFEPTPRTFQSLKANMESRSNSIVNNLAVMDKETEIDFVDYGPKYSAFNSFQTRQSKEMNFLTPPEKLKVKTTSIDKYCDKNKIIPSVIKIDAEGAEHIILKAMTNVLKNYKPIVTIEVAGGEEWKMNCQESIDILISNGYKMFEIDNYGYLHKHTSQDTYSYDNLVFVHPDKFNKVQFLVKS